MENIISKIIPRENAKKFLVNSGTKLLFLNLVYFILSIFIARGTIFGVCAPFGSAIVAVCPFSNLWACVLGTILGYFLPSSLNIGIRYIVTILAIAAIRWTLNDIKNIKENIFFGPIIALLPTLATGFAINSIGNLAINFILITFTESVLSGVGAYFFKQTLEIFSKARPDFTLGLSEIASGVMSFFIIILSFAQVSFAGISLGKIFAITAILISSNFLGILGGSVTGICAGMVFGLATPEINYLAGAYSFGGFFCGLFSKFGKTASALSFLFASVVILVQAVDQTQIITGIYEILVASILFFIIPKTYINRLMNLFCINLEEIKPNALKDSLIMRLNFTSNAISNVANSVDMVSNKLEKLENKNVNEIHSNCAKNVCSACSLNAYCWQHNKEETLEVFDKLDKTLNKNATLTKHDLPKQFLKRCNKPEELIKELNSTYKEFIIRKSAKQKIKEVRGFVCEQFEHMGNIFCDIAKEFENYETFDLIITKNIATFLKEHGIFPLQISSRLNRFGRLTLEIEIFGKEECEIKDILNAKNTSKICRRNMDKPSICAVCDKLRIQVTERPIFKVKIGSAQHVFNNGKLCGDNFKYFQDGAGRAIIILSDGMGTGGRAAIEGAMACEIMYNLINSGISFKTSLKITNSALLLKSEDESLATIDLVCIDLFTGEVEFLKAGAPHSLILKDNVIKKLEIPSLPLGILKELNFSSCIQKLKASEKLLIFSDGALLENENFLGSEFKKHKDKNVGQIAQNIVDSVTNYKSKEPDDDITAIVISLENNL